VSTLTSNINYPASPGSKDELRVTVGQHADRPELEPSFVQIERVSPLPGADRERAYIPIHERTDYECFLDNLIEAGRRAYGDEFLTDFRDAFEDAYAQELEPQAAEAVLNVTVVQPIEIWGLPVFVVDLDTGKVAYEPPVIEDYEEEEEIEEVAPLKDAPPTPTEQQEALTRLINQEVARQRLEDEGRVLSPYLVNDDAADILDEVITERAATSYRLEIDALST
jgi:hypothetical protein